MMDAIIAILQLAILAVAFWPENKSGESNVKYLGEQKRLPIVYGSKLVSGIAFRKVI